MFSIFILNIYVTNKEIPVHFRLWEAVRRLHLPPSRTPCVHVLCHDVPRTSLQTPSVKHFLHQVQLIVYSQWHGFWTWGWPVPVGVPLSGLWLHVWRQRTCRHRKVFRDQERYARRQKVHDINRKWFRSVVKHKLNSESSGKYLDLCDITY
jgi:hypothetical protein